MQLIVIPVSRILPWCRRFTICGPLPVVAIIRCNATDSLIVVKVVHKSESHFAIRYQRLSLKKLGSSILSIRLQQLHQVTGWRILLQRVRYSEINGLRRFTTLLKSSSLNRAKVICHVNGWVFLGRVFLLAHHQLIFKIQLRGT
mgnify:CR=1 FL=1